MKYIEKDYSYSNQEIIAYEEELILNKLDKVSLSDPNVHPTMKGPDVYDAIRSFDNFTKLKEKLLKDQGAICCYCGQTISSNNFIVEHLKPKSLYRHLAGEYENLLLSCKPSEEENSNTKKKKDEFWHCDKKKGHHELNYTPLQSNCASFFTYLDNGKIKGEDELAIKDIETLGLNSKKLKRRRYEAIYSSMYDENDELLSNEELEEYSKLILRMKPNGEYCEFCFAISGAIDHFLHS